MKKNFLIHLVLIAILFTVYKPISAQTANDKIKGEVIEALNLWNTACKNADLEKVMSMFDDSENIMVIGSANGEVSKGKDEIRKWLGELFGFAGFSWEMNRIDIDNNDKTAWVFIEGAMVVKIHNGETNKMPYRFTAILIKKKNVWKWRLFDGSVPQSN